MSSYEELIADALAEVGGADVEPREIEAWMRINYPTLDHLAPDEFSREVRIALACYRQGGSAIVGELPAGTANGTPEPGEGLRFFLTRAEAVDPDTGHASSLVLALITAEDSRRLAAMRAACVGARGTRMVGAAPGCHFARPTRAWIEKIALWTAFRDEPGPASALDVELDLGWPEVVPPAGTEPWYGHGAAGFGVPIEMQYTEIVVGADGRVSLLAREEETGADLRTPEVHIVDLARG